MKPNSSVWWRLRVRTQPWAEDPVASFLIERGCRGLQVEDEGDSVWLLAYWSEDGATDRIREELTRYLQSLEEIHGQPAQLALEVEEIAGQDWSETWKAHFHVTALSPRVVIKPSWEQYDPPPGVLALEIDPGQAFGTGLHPTTRMCLLWMDEMVGEDRVLAPASALDVGTGTGILAIALARLGVGEVWALDSDSVAVDVARENARINRVEDRLRLVHGDLEAVGDRVFPLIVANLTGALFLEIAPELAARLLLGGRLVISGILAQERDRVKSRMENCGLHTQETRTTEEWCAMLLRHGG
jgi:ribosomal protein L11 methyltransferase